MAFYMSVRQAGRISRDLMARGLAPDTAVQVAADISKPSQQLSSCRIDQLESHIAAIGCEGCAILLVTWDKKAAGYASRDRMPVKQVA